MGGHQDQPIGAPPKTVLTSGKDDRSTVAPPSRPIRRGGVWIEHPGTLGKRVRDGKATYSEIGDDVFSRMIPNLTEENADLYYNMAGEMFADENEHIGNSLRRIGGEYADRGHSLPNVLGREENRRKLDQARRIVAKRKRQAREIERQSGLKMGLPSEDKIHFWNQDGDIAFTMNANQAARVAADPRHAAGFALIGAALRGASPEKVISLTNAAIDGSAEPHLVGDEMYVDTPQQRKEAIAKAAMVLATPGTAKTARAFAWTVLGSTLFQDASEPARFFRQFADMAPFLGNAREAQSAYRNFSEAEAAYKRGDEATGDAKMLAAKIDALGAVLGLGGVKLLTVAAKRMPGADWIAASRKIATAQKQGEKPLPPRSVKEFVVDWDEWNKMKPAQQRYASVIYNLTQGRIGESEIQNRLKTLGMNLLRGAGNNARESVTITLPSGKKRIFDEASQDKLLTNILRFSFTRTKNGWTIGFESKLNSATKTKPQKIADDQLVKAAKSERETEQPADDIRRHNSPPDLVDESDLIDSHHAVLAENIPGSGELRRVDEVILLRLSIDQVSKSAVAKAFHRMINSEKNAAMKHVAKGTWSLEEVERIVRVVSEGLEQQALREARSTVYVNELIAGVLVRMVQLDDLSQTEDQR